MKQLSVLTEPIFSVRQRGQRRVAMMPLTGVLATLSHRDDVEFPALQPFQRHAWHAFLTQLGALALHYAKQELSPMSFSAWADMLLKLTKGKDEPFSLLVDNLSKPAFLQCPVPEGTIDEWDTFRCPDSLDVLVTSKNHDVKMARIIQARPEHWIYALVSVQTMQGFWGRGHYGIARMNSGVGSRGCVAMAPSESWGDRFCRDVNVWMEQRKRSQKGMALLWLDPWDGENSIDLKDLDPCFIEACSRLRLVRPDGHIVARGTHVKKPHIAAGEAKGNTGEIWTPIRVQDGAALSLKENPFSYASVCELLFSNAWKQPAALIYREDDGPSPVIVLQGLARAQGKTEGYHERILYPSKASLAAFHDSAARTALYKVALKYIEVAATIRYKVLKPALASLAQAAAERMDLNDERTRSIVNEFNSLVDDMFFTALFADVEGKALDEWVRALAFWAEGFFNAAARSLPMPTARFHRIDTLSRRLFAASLRKHFPQVAVCPDDPEEARKFLRLPTLEEQGNLRRARIHLLANALAGNVSERDLATLRRLATGDMQNETFSELHKRFLHSAPDADTCRKWTVIFRSMAILTGLHRRNVPMGRALAQTGLQEGRLRTLLTGRDERLEQEVNSVVRWLYARGAGFNQGDLADLILSDGHDQEPYHSSWFATTRSQIARAFYAS